MEIGIDSFAAMFSSRPQQLLSDQDAVEQLLARMKFADEVGIDVFGIGEHEEKDFWILHPLNCCLRQLPLPSACALPLL